LVGNGAREHAIAEAICKSKADLYAFMSAKNPGIARLSRDYMIGDTCDPKAVAKYAKDSKINLAVIGPENPLEVGVVDALENAGIDCAGPSAIAAQIETNKSFARNLMKEHRIRGCPVFKVFDNPKEIDDFIDDLSVDVAVKPAGLTGGKGVKIMGEHLKDKEEAKAYAKEILEKKIGTINEVVIEEKLLGEEFTLQAFVSPDELLGMPMVQDHKRAYEGDKGPNTGGMGSYSDRNYVLPFLTQEDYQFGLSIMRDTVKALKDETGEIYKGFLYGQFIVTQNGPKLIEFNARLGDPEAMNTLPIMEGDFVEVLKAMAHGGLEKADVKFQEKATVCKYLVPKGYPAKPTKGEEIEVNENAIEKSGARIYYASVDEKNGKILTSSSRAIAITGIANTIEKAERIAEEATQYVSGPLEHREDIGTNELIQKRFDRMKEIRG